jgi:hypothetical protein
MTATVEEACESAVSWLPTLDQADADIAIATVIERVVAVLRADPRMPRLTCETWRLMFAEVESRSRDELGALIEGKGDIQLAVKEIVAVTAPQRSRKARKQAAEESVP